MINAEQPNFAPLPLLLVSHYLFFRLAIFCSPFLISFSPEEQRKRRDPKEDICPSSPCSSLYEENQLSSIRLDIHLLQQMSVVVGSWWIRRRRENHPEKRTKEGGERLHGCPQPTLFSLLRVYLMQGRNKKGGYDLCSSNFSSLINLRKISWLRFHSNRYSVFQTILSIFISSQSHEKSIFSTLFEPWNLFDAFKMKKVSYLRKLSSKRFKKRWNSL